MSVEKNLNIVLDEIALAKSKALSPRDDIQLVAVSKTHPVSSIQEAIDCGQRVFGENRVQEAQSKWPELKAKNPDIQLHLIGPLQSNKTEDACDLFDVIQSVDREKIARAIAKVAEKSGSCPELFIQVNTGREAQKAGIMPEDTLDFVRLCKDELSLPILGLMCIPPNGENPGPHFALLQKLCKEAGLEELSMGMSQDYKIGIAFGASYVRVGSAIFGQRDYS